MVDNTAQMVSVASQHADQMQEFDAAAVRKNVDVALASFLDRKSKSMDQPELQPLIRLLQSFLDSGGKRLRPLLCVCGWCAAGGSQDAAIAVNAAASLEMFHAFALIHDDVMDRSDTRRGHPSMHRALTENDGFGVSDDAGWFGMSAAILLGDLAFVWSDEMLADSVSAAGVDVRPVLDAMRTEVMFGQYLDLLAATAGIDDLDTALRVLRYKTAKYTIERPLHIGAALGGADQRMLNAFTEFALPVGEAFQLRDDLLGVFGDPTVTGKSTMDDLREGKRTTLIAIAVRAADQAQSRMLRELLGQPDLDAVGAESIKAVLEATGARRAVEQMISARCEEALSVLARSEFPDYVSAALRHIVYAATARAS
jgi:geranylgeranyl diphosphate synthase type I